MKNKIRLSETKTKDPSRTKRITAFILIFIIIFGLLFTINKYGVEFITFVIFIILLFIPVVIAFEKDISNALGFKDSQLEDVKDGLEDVKEEIPEISVTKKMYKIFIICLVIIGIIVSIFLFYKSYKLDKNKEDLTKLIVSNFILINCGALITITLR